MANGSTRKESGFQAPLVIMGTVAVLLFVVALSLFLRGGFTKSYNMQVDEKVYGGSEDPAAWAEGAQRDVLSEGLRWVNQEEGKVGMPIDDAKALVLKKGL